LESPHLKSPHPTRRFAANIATQPTVASEEVSVPDPVRRLSFKITLILVFLQFSLIHQTLAGLLHIDLYLMNIFGMPAICGLLLSGSLKRSFGGRPAVYWCGFAIWMLVALAFSTWRGGSFPIVMTYLRSTLPILLLVAGLTLTWKECEMVMSAAAFGAVVNLFTATFLRTSAYGRSGAEIGLVSNPNDLAGHLILAMSFLLWIGLGSRPKLIRVSALLGVGVGIILILSTASRGGALGLGIAILTFFLLARAPQRIILMILGPTALVMLPFFLTPKTLQRLQSFSATPDSGSRHITEAAASQEAREYLFRTSIRYTLEFPIFGVGPGQFAVYEGTHNRVGGTTHGSWHGTHNSFTQASSECGIPGGFLFTAGMLSSFLLFRRTLRVARAGPNCEDIEVAVVCLLTGTCGFYVAMTFLNFAYLVYGPFLGGLAIAVHRAATRVMAVSSETPAEGNRRALNRLVEPNPYRFLGRRTNFPAPGAMVSQTKLQDWQNRGRFKRR
jgi:O-antigen ligase